jgi:hypothetical protein
MRAIKTCNKDFIALVQLRGTFSTKNNAMNTHFLHDRRKNYFNKSYLLFQFQVHLTFN